MKIRNNWM